MVPVQLFRKIYYYLIILLFNNNNYYYLGKIWTGVYTPETIDKDQSVYTNQAFVQLNQNILQTI